VETPITNLDLDGLEPQPPYLTNCDSGDETDAVDEADGGAELAA
jgi:hypothetical protein